MREKRVRGRRKEETVVEREAVRAEAATTVKVPQSVPFLYLLDS